MHVFPIALIGKKADTAIRPKNGFIEVVMEAEQLNAITNALQDLRARSNELRRYL